MPDKYQLKATFITEDGENFLCIRQFYCNDLRTGNLLDGKQYQGRRFKLIPEEQEKINETIKERPRDNTGSDQKS